MDEYNITYALGNYVINPLPDVKDESTGYYTPLDEIGEIVPYKFMTIEEVKRQAMVDAMRIFDDLYKNNNFLILPDDNGYPDAMYFEYNNLVETAFETLEGLELIFSSIINGTNLAEIVASDYLYTEFSTDVSMG